MHKLLIDRPNQKMLLLGNEAIARGALEAGVAVATTYPGTPSSEISLNLFQISQETDLYFEYSVNEKVSMEIAAAAAHCGVRSMCIMKHVGMNVAADVFMTLAYLGVKGGMVIVSADDPFMFSSQNEQDNRYYAKISGLPMLEPSSVEEAKDMVRHAFDLSEQLQEPVIFRTTTRINHSTAVTVLGDIRKRVTAGTFIKDPFNFVPVPAVSRKLHVRLLNNLQKAEALSEQSPYNQISGNGRLGIACSGVSYGYVCDAVNDLGMDDQVKILRIGFSHPLPKTLIKNFLKDCDKVLVAEEGEPYLEESIKVFAQEMGLTIPINGKGNGLFPRIYEFDPAMVRKVIADYFGVPITLSPPVDVSDIPEIPQRPPNLCAGCSHRATFYALNKASEGMETIIPTDIGCYTLGFLPPLSVGDYLICMGASVGTAGGFSKVTNQKVVSVIGDSTFFHSGIPPLINAVFNNHNVTILILDNGTTAMTGHQPNPGVDMAALNLTGYHTVSIEDVVKGIGVTHISVIKPFNVKKSIAAIKEALAFQGVSVVISRELCTLYAKSLKKGRGKPFRVTEKCKNHRNCLRDLGCPAFYTLNDQVQINADMCAGCSVCAQICPEHAIQPVK